MFATNITDYVLIPGGYMSLILLAKPNDPRGTCDEHRLPSAARSVIIGEL
jgi:hypothetical protein